MRKVAAKSALSGMLTSVADVLFLMVICLLTLGGMLAILTRLEQPVAAGAGPAPPPPAEVSLAQLRRQQQDLQADRGELSAQLRSGEAQAERRQEEARKLRDRLEQEAREKQELERAVALLRQEKDGLEKRLRDATQREADLREMEEIVGHRNKRIQQLEEEKAAAVAKLDGLQGELARRMEDIKREYDKSTTGLRWISLEGVDPRHCYFVLLYEGKIHPADSFRWTNLVVYQVARPQGRGLTLREAMGPGSVLSRKAGDAAWKEKGGYFMLVVARDSIKTFQALRQFLLDKGAKVGWEPHLLDEREIRFSSGGIETGPQSR
jgi:small-conductance mechanosensitive channel